MSEFRCENVHRDRTSRQRGVPGVYPSWVITYDQHMALLQAFDQQLSLRGHTGSGVGSESVTSEMRTAAARGDPLGGSGPRTATTAGFGHRQGQLRHA